MSKFKGTKRKWTVTQTASSQSLRASVNGFLIDCWMKDSNYDTILETNANALLISKAPEMLEMLEDILEQENISQSAHDEITLLIKQATEL